MSGALLAAALAAAVATAEPTETAERQEPPAELDVGDRARWFAQRERWSEAATAFAEAFRLSQRPGDLYNQAQAARFGGDCAAAIPLYRKYLDLHPEQKVREAQVNIEDCKAKLQDDEPAPAPVPVPEPEPEPPPTTTKPDKQRKWYADPAGGVLAALGLVGAAAGGGVLGLGLSRQGGLGDLMSEQAFADARQRSRREVLAGSIVLSVGGALLVGAVIRYAIVARRR